jgi:hypothetical protein
VSQEARDYVETAPEILVLRPAEKMVVRQIAVMYDDAVGCAYCSNGKLARMCMISGKDGGVRQLQRVIKRLEGKGVVARHMTVRAAGMGIGSQFVNEYTFPMMKVSTVVTEQDRRRVFKVPRQRVAAQLCLLPLEGAMVATQPVNRGDSPAVTDGDEKQANGDALRPAGAAAGGDGATKRAGRPVDFDAKCRGGGRHLGVVGEGDTYVSPLDVALEVSSEKNHPLPPPCSGEARKSNSNSNGKNAWSGRRGTGGVREPRDWQAARALLDGEDAALFDEALAVLLHCGLPAESSTRSQRNAVTAQLGLQAERSGLSVAAVGQVARQRWSEYMGAARAERLYRVVGVREFFAGCLWLGEERWSWKQETAAEREDARRRAQASVGVTPTRHDEGRRYMAEMDAAKRQWEAER